MHVITRSCVLFFWMHTLTFVKSQDCTLRDFRNGPLFDSNFDTTGLEASYVGGRQIRVSCNIGYSGFFKLLCVEGKWQSRGTKCQPRSCGHPGDTPFADFQLAVGDDFVFGSQVLYTCQKGYQMVSRTSHRRCLAQGWDGVVPTCEAQQCPVIHVSNNVQVIGDPEEANFGNVVRFSCKSSSEILSGSQEIYCNENGEWSGEAPTCKAINCPVPVIENGRVRGDIQEYKEDDLLHFQCNPGFQPTEDRPSKCTKLGLRAEWSPTPACEPVTCKLQLPSLHGTEYHPSYKNVFSPGDRVTVTCGQRHWISDQLQRSAVVSCQNDGQWSLRPICQEVTCSNRQDPLVDWWDNYWRQQKKLGDEVGYRCTTGYKRTGGATRATCTRAGWTPDPFCEAITCDRHDVANADIIDPQDKYKINDRANYVCKDGYEGEFYRTCRENGWSGSSQCREKKCKKQDIREADIIHNDRESYRHGERVQYGCRKDVEISFTIVCDKGVWTGIQSCTDCPKAEVPHGFVAGPYGDKLYYTCDEGYKFLTNGWWAEAECHGGLWSGLDLCIENNTCGEVPVISHGEVGSLNSHHADGQSVTITCKTGFTGQVESFTCHDGEWNSEGLSLTTICAPDAELCSPPPKVQNAVVVGLYQKEFLSGSEVTYQCRDNYQMEGDAAIRCNDGNWEMHNITCAPQQCPVIHVSNNVQVIGDPEEANVGNVVRFSCKSNSEILSGSQEISCNENGEWSGEAPTCNGKGCPVPVIENGRVPGDIQEYKEDDILPFQCNPGFQPTEDRPSKCTKPGLRAEWSPTPACEPNAAITCKLQLPSLHGTEYDSSDKNVFSPGDTVTVTCGQRHWISDPLRTSEVVSCQNGGQWSLSPICQEVTCSNRQDPLVDRWYDNNWRQQKKLGDEVGYRCKRGYKKTSVATKATCTREGWKPDPFCEAVPDQ